MASSVQDGAVERLLLALLLGVVAAAVALLLTRGRPSATTTSTSAGLPAHLRREDFAGVDVPWLIAVFSSATCDACAGVWARARLLSVPDTVVVQKVDAIQDKLLHRRYGIDAVPLILVADSDGEVVASFLGPTSSEELQQLATLLHDSPGSAG